MSERSGGRLKRIIAVTLGLIGVGAIVGGITSMVALTVVSLAGGARTLHDLTFGLGFAAAFGAAIGAVLAPVEAWILLRRVPLWRAIAETAVGTVLGALAFTLVLPGPIVGAVVGFTLAAIRLRIATRGGRSLKSRSVDALPP